MEMLNVINQTLELLNANSEWQKRYSGYLADIWTNANKADRRFAKPQGLSLYTTVGDRKTKNYYLGRDMSHLNFHGDFMQGAVWFSFLFDQPATVIKYVPNGMSLTAFVSAFILPLIIR